MAFHGADEPEFDAWTEDHECPELLSLAATPEGQELHLDSLTQVLEDERAKAAAELAWSRHARRAA